jgi:hypothetical protein
MHNVFMSMVAVVEFKEFFVKFPYIGYMFLIYSIINPW